MQLRLISAWHPVSFEHNLLSARQNCPEEIGSICRICCKLFLLVCFCISLMFFSTFRFLYWYVEDGLLWCFLVLSTLSKQTRLPVCKVLMKFDRTENDFVPMHPLWADMNHSKPCQCLLSSPLQIASGAKDNLFSPRGGCSLKDNFLVQISFLCSHSYALSVCLI